MSTLMSYSTVPQLETTWAAHTEKLNCLEFFSRDHSLRSHVQLGGQFLPEHLGSISREMRIARYERHLFDESLGNQKPVKWIPMVERQRQKLAEVAEIKRQNQKSVRGDGVGVHVFVGHGQLEFAQAHFDRDFPGGCVTDVLLVRWILDGGASREAQGRAALVEPQQSVRIQQQLHCMCSPKSARGSSKSGANWICPPSSRSEASPRDRPPRLLAAIGIDPQRYGSHNVLQCLAGTAPLSYQSGQIDKVRIRWACDKFLRHTVHLWADCFRKATAWGQTYYEKKRHQGMSHACALRCLGQRLLKIVFKMITDKKPYDAELHARNQQKHGSWVLQLLDQKPAPTTGE